MLLESSRSSCHPSAAIDCPMGAACSTDQSIANQASIRADRAIAQRHWPAFTIAPTDMNMNGRFIRSSDQQERKYRRFHLEYPVYIKFQTGGSAIEVETISDNLSVGGLLVRSAAIVPEHTTVAFIISVQRQEAAHPIYLEGEGEIVRVESSGPAFAIAIECKNPITLLVEHLPLV